MSIVGGEESESSSDSEGEWVEPQLVLEERLCSDSKGKGASRPRKLVNRRITDSVQLTVAKHLRGAEKKVQAISQVMDKSLQSAQKAAYNMKKAASLQF
jgi:hypothetical protein